ncbi:uncharacterized protein LOC126790079 [Argentina anserina]|uniref:uncharacterized protein LOC126790079 n=1 Tax=Argentina anserina TaxID=57926 RepID=UPI002176360C|nr:uncharacterized protein LOC126790079 [Potentilla anserina]
MGLVFFTSVTMLLLSTLLAPCAYSLQSQVQPSTKLASRAAKREVQASQFHALPRKLRLAEMEATVVGQEGQDSAPEHKNVNVLAAGTNKPLIHKEGEFVEVMNRSSSGTWQEWTEGDDEDTSAFFTMDYSKVRRRRPIHNKSLKPKAAGNP